jgi:hypothetical protein
LQILGRLSFAPLNHPDRRLRRLHRGSSKRAKRSTDWLRKAKQSTDWLRKAGGPRRVWRRSDRRRQLRYCERRFAPDPTRLQNLRDWTNRLL